ncbi:MAG TPA: FliA/WhiG family RNA polymerase sigma factor [Terriglobales bacterium]|nr:FliA/WhiG family RNA polymerase sigma factor [Terriglobales bacterium]
MMQAEMAYKGAQGQTAQDQLVMGEIQQVYYIARRIHERLPQHVLFEDLVHSGVLGLIDAARHFDAGKNVQFKSYAQFRIRGAIMDSLREQDWASRRARDKRKHVDQVMDALSMKLGRQPTDEEMAAEMGIELTALHKLKGKLDSLTIVGQQVAYGQDRSEQHDLVESAPANPEEDPFHQCLRTEMRERLAQAISGLSKKEQQVVSLYYREELTMREIAEVMDIGESRVSQLHSGALNKLRQTLEQHSVEGVRAFTTEC